MEEEAFSGLVEIAKEEKKEVPKKKTKKKRGRPTTQLASGPTQIPTVRDATAGLRPRTRNVQLALLYRNSPEIAKVLASHGITIDPKQLRTMSDKAVHALLTEVEDTLNYRNSTGLADDIVKGAVSMAENTVTALTPLELAGLADACFDNEHWRLLLERVKIQYLSDFATMDPLMELGLTTAQTAMFVHAQNVALKLNVQVDPSISAKLDEAFEPAATVRERKKRKTSVK